MAREGNARTARPQQKASLYASHVMRAILSKILTLRHFEQLTNVEAAQALGLSKSTANKRYVPALNRLREIFTAGNGGFSEL
jgi:DNA-directed RNA polymerase specialized sigma24 family protein